MVIANQTVGYPRDPNPQKGESEGGVRGMIDVP